MTPTAAIAKEIKQASGFSDFDELRSVMPDDPDLVDSSAQSSKPGKKKAKVKASKPSVAPSSDPFLNDKRYQEACAEMSAFGGKGVVVRTFDAGARITKDETFKLQKEELRTWDNFFYVLSKKPYFDVSHPIFLFLFFIVTLGSQLGLRIFERNESDLTKGIRELFTGSKGAEDNEDSLGGEDVLQ